MTIPSPNPDPGAATEPVFHRWTRDGFVLTDERQLIEVENVARLLRDTYWASDRPREVMQKAMEHSICLGLFHQDRLIGFGRAVTDWATFAWISDVVIEAEWRGRGLGKWLVECLLEHPGVKTRTQALATRDAHGLYTRHGFVPTEYLRRGPVWKVSD